MAATETRLESQLMFLPAKLRDRLMPFQKEGVSFAIKNGGRCLIADEMGLGKTLQALSAAYKYKDEWPLLIVVPSCLRYPWIEEIEKWLPEISPHDINLIMSGGDISNISTAQITVVTYGLLRHPGCRLVKEALMAQGFHVVIADESHYIKSRKAAGTKFLVPLLQAARRKILLTGTPALARPEELFPQLQALDPKRFSNWSWFAKKFCDAHIERFGNRTRFVTSGVSNPEELHSLLTSSLMIRRLKASVLTQLPPKQRQKIPFDLKDSDLKKTLDKTWDDLQRALGHGDISLDDALQKAGQRDLDKTSREPSSQPKDEALDEVAPTQSNSFNVLARMSQLRLDTCRAKLGPVKDYIKMLCESSGAKMIVFGHHRVMLDSICETLIESGIKFIRIDGSTFQQDRPHLVHTFQVDPSVRFAVLSMRAAGVGLTLTAASMVIFAELDWTPGTMEQCEDRAHRIGQNSNVHVHYLVANSTVDGYMWSSLCRKTAVVSTTLNGRTKVLSAERGNDGLVHCLSNADAYNPKNNKTDFRLFFENQTPKGQKSMLDFFSPKSSQSPSTSQDGTPKSSRSRTQIRGQVISLESDSDDGDFSASVKHCKEKLSTSWLDVSSEANVSRVSEAEQNGTADDAPECIVIDDDLPTIRPPIRKRRKIQERIRDSVQDSSVEDSKPVVGDPLFEEDHSKWNCKACTFLNHDEMPYCEICSTPKAKTRRALRSPTSASVEINGEVPEESPSQAEPPDLTPTLSSQSNLDIDSVPSSHDDDVASCNSGSVDLFDSDDDGTLNQEPGENPPELMEVPEKSEADLMEEEANAARLLFEEEASEGAPPWVCAACEWENEANREVCEGCLESRPQPPEAEVRERVVNLDSVPVYLDGFLFSCSRHTSRIHLFDQEGRSLNMNFILMDVSMSNWAELPDTLCHPENLKHVLTFVKQWGSLSLTKQKMIVRSGCLFANPVLMYNELQKNRQHTKQRYLTKSDVASAAVKKAKEVDGKIRIISRSSPKTKCPASPPFSSASCSDDDLVHLKKGSLSEVSNKLSKDQFLSAIMGEDGDSEVVDKMKGVLQVVNADGTPLCISCQKPYKVDHLSDGALLSHAWQTRFCAIQCAEEFWLKSNREYSRRVVYETERGKCQICGIEAHEFFSNMSMVIDCDKRAAMIRKSKFNQLSSKAKEKMVSHPQPGQFWHVDHIHPVVEGGGQCDLDNLRTLCTMCHLEVTAKWRREKAQNRRLAKASAYGDISAFFSKK